MACAAIESWPIQPCKSEAEVKSSTSARLISPIGRPMRKTSMKRGQSALKKRLKMW